MYGDGPPYIVVTRLPDVKERLQEARRRREQRGVSVLGQGEILYYCLGMNLNYTEVKGYTSVCLGQHSYWYY